MANPDRYILALDQGTTTSRAILFNTEGEAIAQAQEAFPQIYPVPGWVEHDPEAIWRTQLSTAREAIREAQIESSRIAAIGITNQRETAILWEKATGKPVYNAIVWQCRRSAELCRDLRDRGHEKLIREKTGLLLDPYFSATKLTWLFKEKPELKFRAERGELLFGTVDSWLLYKLTGEHRTDVTNASRTLLFNIHTGRWDEELLDLFGIPASVLPEVLPSSASSGHPFGVTKRDIFGEEIPVAGMAGDQQSALFGHACFAPGSVKNTYGTGCFTLMNTGSEAVASRHGLLTTIAWKIGDTTTYALEGSVFMAGAVVQWLRDELGLIRDAAESEQLALSIPDSGGVTIVPAFVGLGAPWWDSEARGTIVGLTRGSGRRELVRAGLESIALQVKDLLDAMEGDCGSPIPTLKADGGASANSFLMQFQADILGIPVVLPEVREITALGAACLAGLSVGYWQSLDEIEANWRRRRTFTPHMTPDERAKRVAVWHRAVGTARDAACKDSERDEK